MTTVQAHEPQMMHRLKLGSKKHSLTNTVVTVKSHHVMRCAGYLPWGKPLLFPSEKLEGQRTFHSDYNCHYSCNIMQREHRSKHFLINCHIFHFGLFIKWDGSSFPSNKFEKKNKKRTHPLQFIHTRDENSWLLRWTDGLIGFLFSSLVFTFITSSFIVTKGNDIYSWMKK